MSRFKAFYFILFLFELKKLWFFLSCLEFLFNIYMKKLNLFMNRIIKNVSFGLKGVIVYKQLCSFYFVTKILTVP